MSQKNLNPKVDAEPAPAEGGRVEKDPGDWVTGEEPMTGAQASYLKKLAERAGESFDPGLSKVAASQRINELQKKMGRG